MEGYSSDVWNVLEAHHNFTTELYEVKNNEWGSIQNNGSWSGMFGMIQENKVDAAINSILMTPLRASVVDFLTALVTTKECIFIQDPGNINFKWVLFLRPFDRMLWFALILSVFLLTILLFGMTSISQNKKFSLRNFIHSFCHILLNMCGVFCAQGQCATSSGWPSRIVHLSAHFIAIITAAAYSSNFIASLAVRIDTLPFTSLEGMLADGSYDFGVLKDSGALNILQNATNDIMKRVYREFILPKLNHLPTEYMDGFQRVCKDPRFALLENYDSYLHHASNLPCKIVTLPEASFKQHASIMVSRTLPYKHLFKHSLLASWSPWSFIY